MSQFIVSDRKDGIVTLTVNRPEARNALNSQVIAELAAAVDELARDGGVRAVIVTGAGDKAFVAGADIAEMKDLDADGARRFAAAGQRAFAKLAALPMPVIAAVNGYALGGGCELALACDVRIASETARFGQPEVGLGITPGFGGTQRLARLVGSGRAKWLIFSGQMISADEALAWGLVERVVPPEQLLTAARELAEKMAGNSPVAIAQAKQAIDHGLAVSLAEGCEIEVEAFGACFRTGDPREGMSAFFEKRRPRF